MGKETVQNRRGVLTAVYKLGKYERVNMEEVKILINGAVNGLAPITVYEKRGRIILEVQQTGWTPLTAYQGEHLTDNVLMAFLKYTLRIAFDCERHGLRIDNLCWDFSKVFADSHGNVRMIYWPVTTLVQSSSTALAFYRQFCGLLLKCSGINPKIAQRYNAYFYQREYLDFPAFQQLLMELIEQWQRDARQRRNEEKKQEGRDKPDHTGSWYYGWLERTDTAEKYPLNAGRINIGRDRSQCQVHIKGYVTVGRLHAQILFQNGQYYLVDNGSRNGTSVDGVPLVKGQRWPLADQARIRFAEVEFVFREAEDKRTMLIHQQKRGQL